MKIKTLNLTLKNTTQYKSDLQVQSVLKMKLYFLGFIPFILAGCATLLSSTEQYIQVTTGCKGVKMPTTCVASNDKGRWIFETPNTIRIKKSAADLTISCQGGLLGNYSYQAMSTATLPMWGNIVAGGGVGAIVDMQNSTAFEYPIHMVLEPTICKFV